jgi:hypothetical protein
MREQEQFERYEDNLFELLMENVALSEGENLIALNQALQNDPNARVPQETLARDRKAIEKQFNLKEFKKMRTTLKKVLNIAAILIAVVTILCATAFAVSEEFHAAAMNFIMDVFEDNVSIRLEEDTLSTTGDQHDGDLDTSWIPEDFVLDSSSIDEKSQWWGYFNSDEQFIKVMIYDATDSSFFVSTEQYNATSITMFDKEALLTKHGDGSAVMTLADADTQTFYMIASNALDDDTLARGMECIYRSQP